MNLHEIKDQFMLNKDSDEACIIEAIKLTGICGGLARELVREWEKLKNKNLDNYPIGLEAKSMLLADFMQIPHGMKKYTDNPNDEGVLIYEFPILGNTEMVSNITPKEMLFHSSWDWFMPVANQCFQMIMKQNKPSVHHLSGLDWIEHNISMSIREYSLAAAFEFAVDFVVSFNINNNQ